MIMYNEFWMYIFTRQTNYIHFLYLPSFRHPNTDQNFNILTIPVKPQQYFFIAKSRKLLNSFVLSGFLRNVCYIHTSDSWVACLTSTLHTLFYEILISILRSNNDQMTFKLSQPSSGNALGDSVPLLYNREPFPPSRLEVLASIEIASSASPTSCRHVVSNSSTVSRNRKTANLRAWRGGRSAPVLCTGKSWWSWSRTRSSRCDQSQDLLAKIVGVARPLET